MSGHPNGRPRIKESVAILFLLTLILASVAADSVQSSSVRVSPGKHDLLLGDSFPTFGSVILSYPDSAILTNTTGDLLFNVTLGLNSTETLQSKLNSISFSISSVNIYIPPDFSGITTTNLWTSYTNNYNPNTLRVSRLSSSDQVGPNWWEITVFDLFLTANLRQVNPENRTFLANQTQYIRLFQVTSPTTAGRYFFKAFINGASIGAQNFPTIVVKASRDPAYISGVLRDSGERNPARAGKPITLPNGSGAQVLATGLDYLGRSVSAQAFINSTADGRYTLFGVAPGTYNITAYAAGYEPATRPWTVTVTAAQSFEGADVYLTESVNITGQVLSKDAEGNLIPWGALVALAQNGTESLVNRAITVDLLNLQNGTVGTLAASTPAPYKITTFTHAVSTEFDFAIQNEVGYDGRIPQNYANYTSGLVFGDYVLQAYVTSYIQLDQVRVHVNNETTSTFSTIPLIRTGQFNVTVHFKNSENGTLVDSPMNACSGSCTLTVSAYDMQGILRAQNTAFVPYGATSWTVSLQGFNSARGFGTPSLFQPNYGILPGTYYITASVTSSPSISGNANLGIATLYFQTSNVLATIGLGEGTVHVSFPVYKAGGVLLDVYSINYQVPPLYQRWDFPGTSINFDWGVPLPKVTWGPANSTQPSGTASKNVTLLGFQTGGYDLLIQTEGYTQQEILHLNVVLCGNTDVAIWMVRDPVIELTVAFQDESLLTTIDSTLPFAQPINNLTATPTRTEVFDDLGNFVAANTTYIANGNTTAHFILAGFNQYYGDPRRVWSGFYDTTDGVRQSPGGLFLYPWNLSPRTFTIRIWIDGYYQLQPLRVTVTPPQDASVVAFVDRASRIIGTVNGPDYFDIARPLSWATITLQPNNDTLTTIIDVEPEYYTTSSLDGSFQVWVPQGTYGMGVSLEGYASYSAQVAVPEGSDVYMYIWLYNYQPSGQLSSTATSIATNNALSNEVAKSWVDLS